MGELDLSVEVTDANGRRYLWDANQEPGSRPRNLTFRTKVGEGFSDASLNLARRIDQDYPDVDLLNDVVVTGADGTVAYEGRISAMPRQLADAHSINVSVAGWMAHAKDRPFREIYVDRDLNAWGPPSRAYKASMTAANFNIFDPAATTDPTDSTAGITLQITGAWASPYKPDAEAWYDAGPGLTVGKVGYSWKRQGTAIVGTDVNWDWRIYVSSDDKATASANSGNLRAAGPSTLQTYTPGVAYRYALLQLFYNFTPAGTDGAVFAVDWYKLAVYGSHGLPTYTGQPGEPPGVTASDVIRDICKRFCPHLDPSGVSATSYVIQHLAFKDLTDPYDAFLELNKYHLFHLGVWDNRRLEFRPYDLTNYDWQVRHDDPGVTVDLQGPSTDSLWGGIVITYTDVLTGVKNILTPDVFSQLLDSSAENPWNRHNINAWGKLELSTPTMLAQALEIGRAALAQNNRPKAPGTITVRGHVKDRAGNDLPAWRIRAGQTIAVTSHPNDAPRLIHETSYDNETKTNTLSIDAPASALDAVFDRLATALTAVGASA